MSTCRRRNVIRNNNNNNDLAVDNPWGGSPCSPFQVELEFGKLVLEGRGKLEDP